MTKFKDLPIGKQAISDQDEDYLEIDKSGSMVGMDISHHKIHKGDLYSATHLFTGITDANSVEMVGLTGDQNAHLIVIIKTEGKAKIEFEKGTTFTSNGTSVTAVNRNENSDNTADSSIYHSPTVDTSGTIFSTDLIPGGGKQNASIGGELGLREEFIVAPNTNHLLRVTNQSGSNSDILIKFIWYEV